jgi:cytochrome c oxidase assembly protein subunit 15
MHGSVALPYRGVDRQPLRIWLYGLAALVFAMVVVGGATRLTESGLSITEWQPILGAIPPLSEADWLQAFEKYKAIPEYQLVNRGMLLEEFKVIYWWEWAHRFLGRLIGLAFLIPFAFFWLTGRIERPLIPKLLGIFALGALQGGLGWFMVMSGLDERVDVSQYRLAAHLTLAALIFAAVLWVALTFDQAPRRPRLVPVLLLLLAFVQIAAGGLVAGLDAGMGYNTWPRMDGALIPSGLDTMSPWWKNLFENALTVQFDHRLLAYVLGLVAIGSFLTERTTSSAVVLAAVVLQMAIGIWTLLAQVPIALGLLHQAGAFLVLGAVLWHVRSTQVTSPSPGRDRQ